MSPIPAPSRPAYSDGFTLVEVVIVVVVMVLLVTVLTSAMVLFIRSEGSVTQRLTDTRDLQNFANYLPGDVASANEILVGGAFVSTPCLGLASTPQLQLMWSQVWRDGSTAEFEIVYDLDGDTLVRRACDASGNRSQILAEHFSMFNLTPPNNGTVKFDLEFLDGAVRRITASSRNYNPTPPP